MASKGEPTRSDTEDFWEEGHVAIEAANRLHVFYLFEDVASFTDSFIKTIKIINEADFAWKDYIDFLDKPVDPDNYTEWSDNIMKRWHDPLWKMAAALVTIHVKRLDIVCDKEDYFMTIEWTCAFFKNFVRKRYHSLTFSEEFLWKWARERFPHNWLPLELALARKF